MKQHELTLGINFYNVQKQAILNYTVPETFPGDKSIKRKVMK